MKIDGKYVRYSWFEIRMANILMGLEGTFSQTNEPLHERKALWSVVEEMKRLAKEDMMQNVTH